MENEGRSGGRGIDQSPSLLFHPKYTDNLQAKCFGSIVLWSRGTLSMMRGVKGDLELLLLQTK